MFGRRLFALAISATLLGTTACQYTEDRETQTGAVIGGLSGAGLGAVIGNQSGDAGKGALIGGVAGTLLGGGVGMAMENQRKRFETELDNVRVQQQSYQGSETIVLTMSDQVLFEFDRSDLLPNARYTLDDISRILRDPQYPQPSRVIITGHTDSRGTEYYNQRLSQARAESVRNYLVQSGINPAILIAEGAGEGAPVAPNDTETNMALNRRVEIRIVP